MTAEPNLLRIDPGTDNSELNADESWNSENKNNMNTASYERLLKLAHQRALDGKGGLAASIAKMCLDSRADLSEEELALTFDILRKLIDKVEIQIRRTIADYLAERGDVPDDLLDFLANDVINVAYPILTHSTQLDDEKLIEVVDNNGKGHKLAVARRHGLTGVVSDHLVKTGDLEVLTQLLKNLSAEITPWGYGETVKLSILNEELHAPILHRRDLPVAVAKRMTAWVGDALRDYIERNYVIDSDTISEAVADAVDSALDAQMAGIDWYDAHGRDHAQRLIGALENGGEAGFTTAVGEVLGLENDAVREMIKKSGAESLSTACRAFGMDQAQFSFVLAPVLGDTTMAELRQDDGLSNAMDRFDSISKTDAQAVINAWCQAAQTSSH